MTWFPVFLLLYALGTGATLLAVPYRQIGKYYFSFHSTVLLILVATAILVGRPWIGLGQGTAYMRVVAGLSMLYAALVLVQNVVVRAAEADLRPDALILPVSAGAVFIIMAAFGWTAYGTGTALLLTLHLLSAAMVLGTSLIAMSTGHWYLANAQLSFDILVRLCRMFVVAIGIKSVIVAIYAISRFEDYWRLEDFYKLVMGVRIAAGIFLAVVLALMSLSCAKRHANQSATGILYVAVVFVLIGETISLYLTLGMQRPI
ncbi:MAG TPA: hypothetical protein VKW04_03020 [Planctomycetota bacterium]|nr:hypothetical protein [Planctomycetota bacterium]